MYSSSAPSTSYSDLDGSIQRIRSCGIYEYLESQETDWTHFQKTFLLSMPIQNYYTNLLNHFQRFRLTARDLLIGYSFVYFDMDDAESQLYRVAKQWITLLHTNDLNNDIRCQLIEALCDYEKVYIEWRNEDRDKMLRKMTQMYWEYEINYRLYETQLFADEKEYYLQEKQSRQTECLSMMKKIDNLEYFHKYQPVYIDSEFSDVLLETLRKAFWNRLKEGLFKEPPDFEPLYAIFREIREHLAHLTTRRPNILLVYDDMIDIEYFIQRQEHQFLDIDFWISRLDVIFDIIMEIDSVERETHHREALQKTKATPSFETCIDGLAYIMNRLLEIRKLYDNVFNSEE